MRSRQGLGGQAARFAPVASHYLVHVILGLHQGDSHVHIEIVSWRLSESVGQPPCDRALLRQCHEELSSRGETLSPIRRENRPWHRNCAATRSRALLKHATAVPEAAVTAPPIAPMGASAPSVCAPHAASSAGCAQAIARLACNRARSPS